MKIALLGYGNMGQEIEKLVSESNKHQIVSISFKNNRQLDLVGIQNADVVIDFSSAEVILSNISQVLALGKNIVIGTSGWYQHIEEIRESVNNAHRGLIYAQNFSIGANIYFKLVSFAASLFARFDNYDVFGYEIHHSGKKDSPSGTANKIAELILKNFPKKKILQTQRLDRKINDQELHFASIRGGTSFGQHVVIFDSKSDEIHLTHQAHSRRGFAEGALLAAEFIQGKKGFYSFDEIFNEVNL